MSVILWSRRSTTKPFKPCLKNSEQLIYLNLSILPGGFASALWDQIKVNFNTFKHSLFHTFFSSVMIKDLAQKHKNEAVLFNKLQS